MIIPKTENRQINYETLSNGIKAIYVEDKDTDKTTVAVSVNVGSYSNPKEFQGIAHFLEHMLFMGSKKYPEEDFYEVNVKKYGGFSNAYTDTFETVYYFSVFNNGVELVMDIFSRFFIDPLFNDDSVNREINAVNSEHLKNINDDNWRIYQMMKNLAIKTNSYNSFATGSKETMNENTIRAKMIEFYNRYYVSENISITIVSNLSIKAQMKMVGKTFGEIKKKSSEIITIEKPIYDNFGKSYQMVPLSDIQQLIYIWETGIQSKYQENKLFNVLNMVLVSAYKNSLYNHLKILGLIESMYINIEEQVGVFSVVFQLTKNGLTKLNEIDGYLKYALKKVFESFKSDTIKNINTYYKKIFELNFNFTEKEEPNNLAIYLANNSHRYVLNEAYSGPHLMKKMENNVSDEFFGYFDKCVKLLVSDKILFENEIKDPNYGTLYGEIDNINGIETEFDLVINLDNDFIDMNPKLINVEDNDSMPITVRDKVWFASLKKFNELTIKGGLIFNLSKLFNNEKNYLLTKLAIGCLSFYLNQELFNIFSLDFNISVDSKSSYNSIVLSYSCPNDPFKFNQFISLTLKLLMNPKIPEIIIHSKIKTMKENMRNIKKENPWTYANYYFNQLSLSTEYNLDNLLKILDEMEKQNITNMLNQHISSIFNESSLSILFVGNTTSDQLPNDNTINKLLFNQQDSLPLVTLPKSLSVNHPNSEEKSNCVQIVYNIGNFEPLRWVHTFMTYLILEQPFFDELRTKKQMGYLVKCLMNNLGNNYYFIQKVQSDKSCDIIKKEIQKFNSRALDIIKQSNLNEWKTSTKNYIEEKDNNTGDVFNRFFSEILSRKYLFNRKKLLIQQLDKVTVESLVAFVKQFIFENEKTCILEINGN